VRYFGGTKLGVSGLIAAYKEAASAAISQSTIIERFITARFMLTFSYADTSLVMALLKEFDAEIIGQEFTDQCQVTFDLRIKHVKSFQSKVEILIATGFSLELSTNK
jgi:putative IMPACT (imprinted ancient) family translation regulator